MLSAEMRDEFVALLRVHVCGLQINDAKAAGHVPWREDRHPSFSADLEKGVWYDHARQEGGGLKEFKQRLGLNGTESPSRNIAATYEYTDESGVLLFQVVRFEPKDFRQRRPDGNGGWIYDLNGVRRTLYRLPEVLQADTVYLVEGEKDADRLRSIGLTATTNPHGAGKWREEYRDSLRGKRVILLPDHDAAGEQHAQTVAYSLLPVAMTVKIVRLPDLPQKGDVSDWFDHGHTEAELADLVEATSLLRVEDLPQKLPAQSGTLTLTKLGDLFNEPEEQVAWLVDKLLPAGGFSLLAAKPKAGKSTLARNLALAVAHGRDFFNRVTQQGLVIYLALEEKRSEVRKHFREMGATGEENIYIHVASAPVDALQQIRLIAEEKKPALIIIDPLFRLARIKDGNDYIQVTNALEPLLTLARETSAHVLCVHHASKGEREGGDSILGSTAIFGSVDTAIFLKRTERYRTMNSIQRYGEELPETILRFDSQTRTITLGETKEREDLLAMKDAIVGFLQTQSEAVEEKDIKAGVEGNNRHKQTALRELVTEERVSRSGEGKKGQPYQFALPHLLTSSVEKSEQISNEKEGEK